MSHYTFTDGWTIVETQHVPDEESARATVFALANGYMGCRGAGEELSPRIPGVKGTYINGIYDTPEGKLTEREFPNVQDWTLITCTIDGSPFDLETGQILDYSRELDMRRGLMRRRIRWRSPAGKVVLIESERFLSMRRVHVGAIRWRLTSEQEARIELTSAVDADVNNRWAQHFREVSITHGDDWAYVETRTFDPGYAIATLVRETVDVPWERGSAEASAGAAQRHFQRDVRLAGDTRIERICTFTLGAGETCTLTKWVSVRESRFTTGDLQSACVGDLDEAAGLGYDFIRDEHANRWAELWDGSDVVIGGDDEAQMGIRFCLFHLLAAAPYHCGEVSIPARGLQGQDYYGSIFWDCEIFVLPFLSYTQPAAARNCLSYRVHTLDGARRKAAGLGYKGAYYAWQSQETGDEQCDLYVFDNPLTGGKIRSYFADEQIHISADIVYAAWQYYQASGDTAFWLDGGAYVAVEVARFYVSRATWNAEKGRFELLSVLGPDEYHERVNNNAYTNALAAESIRIALEVLEILRAIPGEYERLVDRLVLDEQEIAGWKEFSSKLYLPEPDPDTGLIPQFDGYFDLEDVSVEETRKRLAHPDLHPGGPLGPFQTTQNIKQADVVMLCYLLRDRFDRRTKRANWEYYEKRTAHDSSLSHMAYSLVAADVGMLDWAYKYFIRASHIDLASYGPHWNLGIHAASLGGAWLALVHGFCRLRLDLDGVHITDWPALPRGWTGVEIRFTWHGQPLTFYTDGKLVEIRSRAENDVPVVFPDGEAVLKAGSVLRREPSGTQD